MMTALFFLLLMNPQAAFAEEGGDAPVAEASPVEDESGGSGDAEGDHEGVEGNEILDGGGLPGDVEAAQKPQRNRPVPASPVLKTQSKARQPRERQTEGTTARKTFDADVVIESKYRHNGKPLEVDPD